MKTDDDMLPEYDLTALQSERGRYYQAYRQGHQVNIYQENMMETHYFTLEEGAVMLEPDVLAHFSNSESVNRALRGLIANISQSAPHTPT